MFQQDSVPAISAFRQDSNTEGNQIVRETWDTAVTKVPSETLDSPELSTRNQLSVPVVKSETIIVKTDSSLVNTKRPDHFIYPVNEHNNIILKPENIWHNQDATFTEINFEPQVFIRSQLNWSLCIGFISIVLLLSLKIMYGKFLNLVLNSSINYQIADKLLREKNIIVKRAFLLLNINYLLIFSLFTVLLLDIFDVSLNESFIMNYLIIFGLIAAYMTLKLIANSVIAFVFESYPAINQQIHNSFLINKNMGLFLFPLVIVTIYASPGAAKVLLFTGLGILFIGLIIKTIRGIKIILRNDILFFYAILYLCTLELLPLLLGLKLIM